MSLQLFHSPQKWTAFADVFTQTGMSLGFVPTMGALHAGHLALVERAKRENDKVLVSIFVNPTQSNNAEDLARYPRHLEKDLELLKHIGADFVLAPVVEDVYPEGLAYLIQEKEMSKILEGEFRPGHFDGMLTVVMKLLNMSRARKAYFGEKDFQQLQLVRGMAKAFFMKVEIVPCATVRAEDGLALSSRNERLSPEDRSRAAMFAQILRSAPSPEQAREELLKEGFEIDYVETWRGRRLAAVKVGDARLIDNVEETSTQARDGEAARSKNLEKMEVLG